MPVLFNFLFKYKMSFGPKRREKGKFELVTSVPPLVAVGYVVGMRKNIGSKLKNGFK